jgi:hypothetical protein
MWFSLGGVLIVPAANHSAPNQKQSLSPAAIKPLACFRVRPVEELLAS